MAASSVGDPLGTAADHATRFRQQLPAKLQRPQLTYSDALTRFQEPLPDHGKAESAIIEELVANAEPGLHAMAGDSFFGWVIGGSHQVGVAADWLTSAWGQNAGNHQAAPAAAAVETVAGGWLLELLDLPRGSSVGFVTGATMANFVCLAAARSEVLRQMGWDVDAQGLFGAPPITVLIGDDAHTTVFSALQFLGLGHDRVVRVATDESGRVTGGAFEVASHGASGPCIVIMQAGQINTGAFDEFASVIPIARQIGAWIHIDGAFGLWARATPERKHNAAYAEQADSWAADGHKWLQTPYDCGYAFVRNPEAHRRAMTISASYLPPAQGGDRDPSHYVPELSRRARGFATWAIIKHLGRDGIAAMVERHCRVAENMARIFRSDNRIAVLNDVVLNRFVVRFGVDRSPSEADRLTRLTIARLQAEGKIFAGGAEWRGQQVMRISVISWLIDDRAGVAAATAILDAWHAVLLS